MAACVKHAARAMVKGHVRGSIVCTASVAASRSSSKGTDYYMSKHAVLGLVRSTSVQLGEHDIRVNCVSPSGLATSLTRAANGMETQELQKCYAQKTNLKGVFLTPKHVADAVLFLASGDSGFVTGHDLSVDGGFVPA
ncbi:Short-chain dehydrogenase/reductase SDR [Sesbania bispinosa]|nr:Short-chain dehydrogenase/reductase SDR [Sesbania bispinosa]